MNGVQTSSVLENSGNRGADSARSRVEKDFRKVQPQISIILNARLLRRIGSFLLRYTQLNGL